jgi:hypothetical protein
MAPMCWLQMAQLLLGCDRRRLRTGSNLVSLYTRGASNTRWLHCSSPMLRLKRRASATETVTRCCDFYMFLLFSRF